jgi:hypothetical protein
MTANHDLERRVADFYATEAPPRAPDWVLGSALATIDDTRQRRAFIRVPWRFPPMNSATRYAIAAVAVIAVGAIGLAVLRPGSTPAGGVGSGPSPSPPAASPSLAASPSSSPSPSAPPPLTETYTSAIHGISISYPTGWKLRAASEPWTTGIVQQDSAFADVMYESETDSPFIAVASQDLAGKTADRWAADYVASLGDCGATEPVTVDGASGVLAADCHLALVSVDGRGYLIWLYRVDSLTWFRDILDTVTLSPGAAVTAGPSPSP